MLRGCFSFMWCFFHVGEINTEWDNQPAEEKEDWAIDLVDIRFEWVQVDQENEDNNEVGEEELANEEQNKRKVWYEKLTFMIDHVQEASYSIIHVLGTFLPLNEMMIRFLEDLIKHIAWKIYLLGKVTNYLFAPQNQGTL